MELENNFIAEVPDIPVSIRNDPQAVKKWNEYWEAVIRLCEDEREQERRNRRTR